MCGTSHQPVINSLAIDKSKDHFETQLPAILGEHPPDRSDVSVDFTLILKVALALGASAKNITSRYDGTALIAAAHLGHVEVVKRLIHSGAPLDHVNNLGWTALIESIVLGDGGPRHTDTLKARVEAGA